MLKQLTAAAPIVDALGRSWDADLHPRDRKGKFIHTLRLIRAFATPDGAEPWATGNVEQINNNGSVRMRVQKVSDPKDSIYVGQLIDVKGDSIENINEKATLSASPTTGALQKWDFHNNDMRDFAKNAGISDEDYAAASQAADKLAKGQPTTNRSKYHLALYAKARSGDGKQHSNGEYMELLDAMGAPPDVVDDTPDGMSGLKWLQDTENGGRSPDNNFKDSISWFQELPPTDEGVIRSAQLLDSDVRVNWHEDGTQSIRWPDGTVEQHDKNKGSLLLAAQEAHSAPGVSPGGEESSLPPSFWQPPIGDEIVGEFDDGNGVSRYLVRSKANGEYYQTLDDGTKISTGDKLPGWMKSDKRWNMYDAPRPITKSGKNENKSGAQPISKGVPSYNDEDYAPDPVADLPDSDVPDVPIAPGVNKTLEDTSGDFNPEIGIFDEYIDSTEDQGYLPAVHDELATNLDWEENGLSYKVTTAYSGVDEGEFGVHFKTELTDTATGNVIGSGHRIIQRFNDGTMGVYLSELKIDEKFQGQGVGARQLRDLRGYFKAAGATNLHLFADMSVGGYAWARAGATWDPESVDEFTVDQFLSRARQTVVDKSDELDEDELFGFVNEITQMSKRIMDSDGDHSKWPTPWEISRIGDGHPAFDGMHPGKVALLGHNWYGQFDLEDTAHADVHHDWSQKHSSSVEAVDADKYKADYPSHHLDVSAPPEVQQDLIAMLPEDDKDAGPELDIDEDDAPLDDDDFIDSEVDTENIHALSMDVANSGSQDSDTLSEAVASVGNGLDNNHLNREEAHAQLTGVADDLYDEAEELDEDDPQRAKLWAVADKVAEQANDLVGAEPELYNADEEAYNKDNTEEGEVDEAGTEDDAEVVPDSGTEEAGPEGSPDLEAGPGDGDTTPEEEVAPELKTAEGSEDWEVKDWLPAALQKDGVSGPVTFGDDIHAVGYYMHGTYIDINSALRDDSGDMADEIAEIDQLMDEHISTNDHKVYRGTSFEGVQDLEPGSIVTDKAYISTSMNRSIAEDFAGKDGYVYEIDMPAGTHAFYIPSLFLDEEDGADSLTEEEMLVDRGTPMRVDSIDHENRIIKATFLDKSAVSDEVDPELKLHLEDSKNDKAVGGHTELVGGEMSVDEQQALQSYVGSSYRNMNRHLRDGFLLYNSEDQKNFPIIKKLLGRSKLREDTTVYRGMRADEGDSEQDYENFINALEPGAVIEDKGFLSTTADYGTAEEFAGLGPWEDNISPHKSVLIEMSVPKGANALDVNDAFGHEAGAGEAEILFPPGRRMRITEITEDDHVFHVKAEYVHDDEAPPEPTPFDNTSKGAQFLPGSEDKINADPDNIAPLTPEVAPEPDAVPGKMSDFSIAEPLNSGEQSALTLYGFAPGYKLINPFLHHDKHVFDTSIMAYKPATPAEIAKAEKAIKNIDSAFEKATPLDHPVIVQRRSGLELFTKDDMTGETFENLAYTSTATKLGSHGYGYETKPAQWNITLPAGTKALHGNAHENEILLPRGAKFTVDSDEMIDGVRHLGVTYLPHGTDDSPVDEEIDLPQSANDESSLPKLTTMTGGPLDQWEIDALDIYLGVEHMDINDGLRSGSNMADYGYQEHIDALDGLIDRGAIDSDTTVFRGIASNGPYDDGQSYNEFMSQVVPGATVQDLGYVSTTRDKNTADKFSGGGNEPGAVFEINVPAGSKAYDTLSPVEQELILPRGSHFRIDSVDTDANGQTRVVATVVPNSVDEPDASPDYGLSNLTPSQYNALDEYQSASLDINDTLRSIDDDEPTFFGDLKKYVESLDELISTNTTDDDMTLYRGLNGGADADGSKYQELLDNLKPGYIVEDKAYTSMSGDLDIAKQFMVNEDNEGVPSVLFEVDVPKGANAYWLDGSPSVANGEDEHLFGRNSRIQITAVTTDDDGNFIVKAKYLLDGDEGDADVEVPAGVDTVVSESGWTPDDGMHPTLSNAFDEVIGAYGNTPLSASTSQSGWSLGEELGGMRDLMNDGVISKNQAHGMLLDHAVNYPDGDPRRDALLQLAGHPGFNNTSKPDPDSLPPIFDDEGGTTPAPVPDGPGPGSTDFDAMVDADGPYRWHPSGTKVRIGMKVKSTTDGLEGTVYKFEKNHDGAVVLGSDNKKRGRKLKKLELLEEPDGSTPTPEPEEELMEWEKELLGIPPYDKPSSTPTPSTVPAEEPLSPVLKSDAEEAAEGKMTGVSEWDMLSLPNIGSVSKGDRVWVRSNGNGGMWTLHAGTVLGKTEPDQDDPWDTPKLMIERDDGFYIDTEYWHVSTQAKGYYPPAAPPKTTPTPEPAPTPEPDAPSPFLQVTPENFDQFKTYRVRVPYTKANSDTVIEGVNPLSLIPDGVSVEEQDEENGYIEITGPGHAVKSYWNAIFQDDSKFWSNADLLGEDAPDPWADPDPDPYGENTPADDAPPSNVPTPDNFMPDKIYDLLVPIDGKGQIDQHSDPLKNVHGGIKVTASSEPGYWKFTGPGEQLQEYWSGRMVDDKAFWDHIGNSDDQQVWNPDETIGAPDPEDPWGIEPAPEYDPVAHLASMRDAIPHKISDVLKKHPSMNDYQAKQYRNAGYAMDDMKQADPDSYEFKKAYDKAVVNLTNAGPLAAPEKNELQTWLTNVAHPDSTPNAPGSVESMPDGAKLYDPNYGVTWTKTGNIWKPDNGAFLDKDNVWVQNRLDNGFLQPSGDGGSAQVVTMNGYYGHDYAKQPDGSWVSPTGPTIEAGSDADTDIQFYVDNPNASVPSAAPEPKKPGPYGLDAKGDAIYVGDKVVSLSDGDIMTIVKFESNGTGVVALGSDGKKRGRKMSKLQSLEPDAAPYNASKNMPNPKYAQGTSIISKKKVYEPDPSSPWYGKDKPEMPKQPVPQDESETKKYVSDSWLAAADAHYQQWRKENHPEWGEKSLSQSLTYKHYTAVVAGDKSELEWLKNSNFISDELYQDAKNQLEKNLQSVIDQQDKYNADLEQWRKDSKAWRLANGMPDVSLRGMTEGVHKWNNQQAIDYMNKHHVAGSLNATGKLSLAAASAISSQKGEAISGDKSSGIRALGPKSLDKTEVDKLGYAAQTIYGADQAMLESPPVAEDFITTRTFDVDALINPDTGKPFTSWELGAISNIVGTIQHDWGFAETSPGALDAGATIGYGSARDVYMQIRVPAGTRGVWTLSSNLGLGFQGERGFLLERGIAYYIHSVEKKNGHYYVDAEIIPKNEVNYDEFGHFVNENPFFD